MGDFSLDPVIWVQSPRTQTMAPSDREGLAGARPYKEELQRPPDMRASGVPCEQQANVPPPPSPLWPRPDSVSSHWPFPPLEHSCPAIC